MPLADQRLGTDVEKETAAVNMAFGMPHLFNMIDYKRHLLMILVALPPRTAELPVSRGMVYVPDIPSVLPGAWLARMSLRTPLTAVITFGTLWLTSSGPGTPHPSLTRSFRKLYKLVAWEASFPGVLEKILTITSICWLFNKE